MAIHVHDVRTTRVFNCFTSHLKFKILNAADNDRATERMPRRAMYTSWTRFHRGKHVQDALPTRASFYFFTYLKKPNFIASAVVRTKRSETSAKKIELIVKEFNTK